ncbi:MAG: hemerythrin domain-containing protein [Aquabacterium sp.]
MKHLAESVIQDEHQALAAMLRSIPMLVDNWARQGEKPDFALLRAMLFYIDEFPERLHHPKESELLFPRLRQRCPDLTPVLNRLDQEHQRGEAAIRHLERALLGYEVMGEPRREAFEIALHRYIDAYLEHMSLEERKVMPAAREHLTEADWAQLDEAFAANRDPLTGHPVPADYQPLFRRIVTQAPAPVGLG